LAVTAKSRILPSMLVPQIFFAFKYVSIITLSSNNTSMEYTLDTLIYVIQACYKIQMMLPML
jgi:hypothetical protein